jgi:hypothetical protein
MTVYNIPLPIYDDVDYTYSVALQGQSYILQLTYNERVGLYFLSLFNEDTTPILQGVGLVPEYPIAEDYALYPLTGFFWLQAKADIISEPYKIYPDKLSQYYDFYYTYITED